PIDPGSDRVGGPAVGEALTGLEDGDQGQPPGREGGLAPRGERSAKSASVKRVPSGSRSGTEGWPSGKATRATWAVFSGTGEMRPGCNDIALPQGDQRMDV